MGITKGLRSALSRLATLKRICCGNVLKIVKMKNNGATMLAAAKKLHTAPLKCLTWFVDQGLTTGSLITRNKHLCSVADSKL